MKKAAASKVSSDGDYLEQVKNEEVDTEVTEEIDEENAEEEIRERLSEEQEEAHDVSMYVREGPLLWPRVEFKDREKIPRKRITFIPAERFDHFGFHPYLNTYIPFSCDLSNMQLLSLQGIEFLWFLAYIDASENLLRTHTLGHLLHQRNLIALKLDNNHIDNIVLPYTLTELQYLDLAYNNIEKIPPRELATLESLRLDSNKIKKLTNLTKQYFPKLKFVSLTSNQIDTLKHSWSNNLVYLYLGYNEIRNVEGLEGLYKLRVLHLRGNLLMTISNLSADLVSLEYLNIRDNKIADLRCIEHLARYEYLSELIVLDNPFTTHPVTRGSYKYKILQWLQQLKRLNKELISDGMRAEAEHPHLYGEEEEMMSELGSAGKRSVMDSDDASA